MGFTLPIRRQGTVAVLVSIGMGLLLLCMVNIAWAGAHQRHASKSSMHRSAHAHPIPRGKNKSPKLPQVAETYALNSAAMAWSDDTAAKKELEPAWVRQAIGQARKIPVITQYVMPASSPTAKNWRAYRTRFIEPIRIQAGLRFWQTHAATLARAEQIYGVPAEVIVGIIGVETLYGKNTGNFRVIDALATLAFDFPTQHPRASERQAYFANELAQFLMLAHRNRWDPLLVKGSYAGAMGWPQFMPGSWAQFAVDFDGDGQIDLFNNPADVIGSVANYFKAFNWRPGMSTHYPVRLDASRLNMDALMAPDILPTFSVSSFVAKGAVLEGSALEHLGPLALIELQNGGDVPTYVAGTENFYAITRYNWSSYYAMAVIELGQEVKAARQR